MAQVWLTYEELGQFCSCSPAVARELVIENQWARRKSSDGLTRVKLPLAMMRDFISHTAASWQGTRQTALALDADAERSGHRLLTDQTPQPMRMLPKPAA